MLCLNLGVEDTTSPGNVLPLCLLPLGALVVVVGGVGWGCSPRERGRGDCSVPEAKAEAPGRRSFPLRMPGRLLARSEARPGGSLELQGGARRKRGQRVQGRALSGASLGGGSGRGMRRGPGREGGREGGRGGYPTPAFQGAGGRVGERRWPGPPARRLSRSPEICPGPT